MSKMYKEAGEVELKRTDRRVSTEKKEHFSF